MTEKTENLVYTLQELERKFGLFIFPKQLVYLYPGIKIKSAYSKYLALKDSLGKLAHQKITVEEIAKHEDINPVKVYLMVFYYPSLPSLPIKTPKPQ